MSSDLVVAVVVQCVVTFAAIVTLRTVLLGRASRQWPTAQGRVEGVEVCTEGGGGQRATTYRPTITYRYRVKGREYVGHRIRATNFLSMGVRSFTQSTARAALDGYHPGAPVAVYFDPQRPGESLLQPGVTSMQYVACALLVVAIPLLAGAFWVAFSSLRT